MSPSLTSVSFLRIKEFVLPTYVLRSFSERAAGFQNFREIPRTYGLFFPDTGQGPFHMHNVGAALGACGLVAVKNTPNTYKILTSKIWQPEGECPYSGDAVLECHPDYLEVLKPGIVCVFDSTAPKASDLRLLSL